MPCPAWLGYSRSGPTPDLTTTFFTNPSVLYYITPPFKPDTTMPGSGKQSPEVQAEIRQLLEAGFDPTSIHRRLKVGRSSIYRMKRCLQQHGTNYMPTELNKKNGRPKVLTPEQELEVRDWLRDPKNRNRYLDDLVWLIHDRFKIVCSTTTMSKMKRKWLRVIEYEETGNPIDESTRVQLMETHPDLPLLHEQSLDDAHLVALQAVPLTEHMQHPFPPELQHSLDHQLQPPPPEPQIDSRLEQRLHDDLTAAAVEASHQVDV